MGRFIDLNKEYDKISYARVINLMKERKLPLLEPIYYFNTVVDVNGNIIKRLFYVNQRTLYNKGWTKQEEYVNRRDDGCIGEIYSIVNNRTEKRYIGQSENFFMRKENHVNSLFAGKHTSTCLQLDFYLLGQDQFTFEILESVKSGKSLTEREEELIIEYNTEFPNGYNSPIKGNKNLRKSYSHRYSKLLMETHNFKKKNNNSNFYMLCVEDYKEKKKELIKKIYLESKGQKYFFEGFSRAYFTEFPPFTDLVLSAFDINKDLIENLSRDQVIKLITDIDIPDNFKKKYYYIVDTINREYNNYLTLDVTDRDELYDDPFFESLVSL